MSLLLFPFATRSIFAKSIADKCSGMQNKGEASSPPSCMQPLVPNSVAMLQARPSIGLDGA